MYGHSVQSKTYCLLGRIPLQVTVNEEGLLFKSELAYDVYLLYCISAPTMGHVQVTRHIFEDTLQCDS